MKRLSISALVLLPAISLTFADQISPEKPKLRDVTFRCCVLPSAPYIYPTRRSPYNYDGPTTNMFLRLQDATGFRCENETLNLYQSTSGVGFNEFVQRLAKCADDDGVIQANSSCPCDFGVGAWFNTPGREIVDFLPIAILDDIKVMMHIDSTTTSGSSLFFLRTFGPFVWMLMGFLMVFFAVLKFVDSVFLPTPPIHEEPDDRRSFVKRAKFFLLKNPTMYRLRKASKSTMLTLIHRNPEYEGEYRTIRHWLINFSISICGLVLVIIYEGMMTALLLQEERVSPFQSLADIESCAVSGNDICFVSGDSVTNLWNEIVKNYPCQKKGKPNTFSSYTNLVAGVRNGSCKYGIADGGTIGSAVNERYCGILVSSRLSLAKRGASFVVPKNWPYYDEMRLAMLDIIETGSIPATIEEYFIQKNVCEIFPKVQLSFKKLRGLFILLGVSCAYFLFQNSIYRPQAAPETTPSEGNMAEGESPDKLEENGMREMVSYSTNSTDAY